MNLGNDEAGVRLALEGVEVTIGGCPAGPLISVRTRSG